MSLPPLVFEKAITVLAIFPFLGKTSLNSSVLLSPFLMLSINVIK
jgi:hypothetical protein